jgi:PAS domain S-box-containing protein
MGEQGTAETTAGRLRFLTDAARLLGSGLGEQELFGHLGELAREITGARRAEVILGGESQDGQARIPGRLMVPMLCRDGTELGRLELSDKYDGDFSDEDEELAAHLAQLAAVAVENERLLKRVREAEVVVNTMQAAAPVGLALIDEDLRYLQINSALAAINGLPPEDHIGRTVREVLGDELADEVEPTLRQVLETQAPAQNRQVSGRTRASGADGGHWLLSHYPVEAAGIRAVGVVVVDVSDQHEAHERLKRSEARYRNLVETTQDLVWTVDATGCFGFLNGAVERIYGYSAEELIGRPFVDFVPPEQREWMLREFANAKNGALIEGQAELLRKDGTRRLVEFRSVPVLDERGEVVAVTGTSTDVTERARSERALRESEERFRGVFEHAEVGMLLMDARGRVLFANPAFCRLVDRPEQELRGLRWQDIVHPHDRDVVRARRDRHLAGETEPGALEVRYVRKDGQAVWARTIGAAVRDADGRIAYTILQAVDLTEQRRLEQTASRMYALTRDLFCTVGFDGCIKTANPAWERALGYSTEEMAGQPFLDLVHPDDRPRTMREFERLLASGELTIDFENRYQHKDGSYRWLLWSSYVSMEERLVYGVAKDVTDRRRSEDRLRASERKYRDLVETSSDLIWSVDVGGRFTFVNRAVRRIYGYEPEEMLGRPIADFESDEQRVKDEEAFRRVMAGTPLFNYETRHIRKDGRPVDLSVNTMVLHDESGAVLGATGTATDISDRKRSEARQAAVAELGRRALEGVGVAEVSEAAVALVAETLSVEYGEVLELTENGDQLRLYAEVGWPEGSVGQLTPARVEASHAAYAIQLDGPVVVEDFDLEERFERPPTLAELEVRSGVCVTIEGESRPFGVLGAHSVRRRSFTQDEVNFLQAVANVLATAIGRKQTEQRIVELASARGRLVAQTLAAEDRARRGISEVLHDHALQDLLASRQDLVEVLEDPDGDPERVVRAREGIERAVQLLREAVFNLHPVVLEHAGLASAIRAVADHQARRGGFTCEIQVDDAATGIHDELVLSLARELLTNAAKHAEAQHVSVSVGREDAWVALTVTDDGKGFASGRREAALREGHVGLASSAERVEALAGRFEVDSKPGEGTRARAVLPARRAASHRADVPGRLARLSARQRGGDR